MFKILRKEEWSPNVYAMDIEAPRVAKKAQAGQFIVLRVNEEGERIPLTIADFDRVMGRILIVFQAIGASTMELAALEAGDSILDFVGPLGRPSEIAKLDGTMVVVGGGSVAGGLLSAQPVGLGVIFGGLMLSLLLSLALSVPVVMAIWFAPALVFFNNMQPVEALKASFEACMKNVLAFLVYGLIVLVLAFFAALPVGLGFLVLIPVLAGSVYAAYRDVFVAN